jgi:peptidyl-prolyl cis-trans isomerase SurA
MRRASRTTHLFQAICALLVLGIFSGQSAAADPAVHDGVIAIVGERIILLSALRERAKPFLAALRREIGDPGKQRAAERNLARDMIERLVDEALVAEAARRATIRVTPADIDEAIARIAQQNHVPVTTILEEARKSGLSEAAYRSELGRQILEGKMLSLVLSRKGVSVAGLDPKEQGARLAAEQKAWLAELRYGVYIEIRLKIE